MRHRLYIILLSFICFLEVDSQIQVQKEYDFVDNKANSHGVRMVGIDENGIETFGCIDRDGKEIIPLMNHDIYIYDDYILISTERKKYYNNIAPQSYFVYQVYTGDGLRLITKNYYGKIELNQELFSFHQCFIVKSLNNDKYGIINDKGVEVVKCIYDNVQCIDSKNGIFLVSLNRNEGFIGLNGKEIIPIVHSSIEFINGFAIVDNKMLINYIGKTIIPSGVYDELKYLNGWVLWARQGDRHSIVDINGNIVVPLKNYGQFCPYYINERINNVMLEHNRKIGEKNIFFSRLTSTTTVLCLYKGKEFEYFNEENKKTRRKDRRTTIGLKINKIIYLDDKGQQYDTYEAAYNSNLALRQKFVVNNNNNNDNNKDVKKTFARISWLSPSDNIINKEYELKIGIKSESKISSYMVSVNGEQDRGIKPVEQNEYSMTISKNIILKDGNNIIKVSVTNEGGTTQEEKTIIYKQQGYDIPTIDWLDFAATANKKDYQIKLGIKSKSKIEEVNVSVNGDVSRGIKPVNVDGFDMTIDRMITLSEGLNRIIVSVRNGEGIATSEKVIKYVDGGTFFNDKRIALIIGNSHYSKAENNLANPENDATDVAEKLKGLGFEVMLQLDASLKDMRTKLSEFKNKAKDYDVALFYYAGHGIQSKGANYLIPSDINGLNDEEDLEYNCENMQHVLDVMDASSCKLKIVILDACRDNPLARSWHRSGGSRGLSLIQPPSGTLISFSTSPGKTASDGSGLRNSPYTAALLQTLDIPNLELLPLFKTVNAEVKKRTKQAQNPWFLSDFSGDFYFNNQ